jgi:hypothetical protein
VKIQQWVVTPGKQKTVVVVVVVVIKVKSVIFVNLHASELKANYKTRKNTFFFYFCGAATRDFAITLIGHTTLYSTPLDECSADVETST